MILLLFVVSLTLPLFIAWRLWRLDEPNLVRWLIPTADGLVFFCLILIVARWDMAGMHLRWLMVALVLGAAVVSLARHLGKPAAPPSQSLLRAHGSSLGSLLFFAAVLVYVLAGMMPQSEARNIAFPLADGTFVVGQGGGNWLLNYHSGHAAQNDAVDIVAVSPLGFRAAGLLPDDIEAYAVTDAPIVSPCAGEVVETADDLPDQMPPDADTEHPAGNHVVLACEGLRVELAHMRQGSIEVVPRDAVEVGTLLGRVGNSGNTTEPHLHIHAVDAESGLAVPLRFDGVTPVRNRSFTR